jgi:predicted DNA-binding transcriptional regulator AlpA
MSPSTIAPASIPPSRRALRRAELQKIIPLSNTTIYEMEQRGDFPKGFYLTPRCVVWDSDEVYDWLTRASNQSVQMIAGLNADFIAPQDVSGAGGLSCRSHSINGYPAIRQMQ